MRRVCFGLQNALEFSVVTGKARAVSLCRSSPPESGQSSVQPPVSDTSLLCRRTSGTCPKSPTNQCPGETRHSLCTHEVDSYKISILSPLPIAFLPRLKAPTPCRISSQGRSSRSLVTWVAPFSGSAAASLGCGGQNSTQAARKFAWAQR